MLTFARRLKISAESCVKSARSVRPSPSLQLLCLTKLKVANISERLSHSTRKNCTNIV